MHYTTEEEELFRSSGEKSECMGILHMLSFQKYNKLSVWCNIPVIVLSSAIGFITTLDLFHGQTIMLGTLSIFVSLIKSVENYFSITTRAEAHRITSLNYHKIAKLIEVQLALKREDRIQAIDLLDVITNDIANLRESEPSIDDDIIKRFNQKYGKEITSKPSIVNGLTQIKICQTTASDAEIQVTLHDDSAASLAGTVSSVPKPRWK